MSVPVPTARDHDPLTRFAVGDVVKAERCLTRWPSTGSWPKYEGRVGRVVVLNVRDREVGVCWNLNDARQGQADNWSAVNELVVVEPAMPGTAPVAAVTAANAQRTAPHSRHAGNGAAIANPQQEVHR